MSTLVVEDLRKTYPAAGKAAAVEAVRGLSFEVRRGEFFGLLGPNGAGKSTTIGCITTLVRPTGGRIAVDGIDVVARAAEAKRRLAVVPQNRNLDRDLSIRELLLFHGLYFGLPRAAREERALRLLRELQLQDKADSKPAALSGGMQQRAMIARALMHDPALLLLDEPTTGLDPQARRALWDLLKEQHARGLTIVLTTHYMDEADRLCERLAIVDHGRILTEGTPQALRRSLPGGRVLDLWARGGAPLGERLGALAGVQGVEPVTDDEAAHPGVERLRLFVETQDGLLDRVLHEVRAAGAELDHVSLAQPSLEDVYIHLTGKELRE